MRTPILCVLVVLAGAALGTAPQASTQPAAPAAASQPPAPATVALRIRGAGLKDLDLSMADLKAMPRRTLTVKEKQDGTEITYSGVAVEDILAKAGLVFGQALRGPKLRDYLLAEAGDGYGVVFALPEISTEFSDRLVIVADTAGDQPLVGREGPLKVIVSDEKKHARWVRNVAALTVRTSAPETK